MKRQLSPAQIEHNRAIARKGGLARARQFTPDYQRQALYRRNELYGEVMLKEWGAKGYYRAMQATGFEGTTLMNYLQQRFGL